MKRSLSAVLFMCCVVLVSSCSSPRSPKGGGYQATEAVNCIAVLPTRAMAEERGVTESVTLRRGASLIDSVMAEEIGANARVRILSQGQLDALYVGEGAGLTSVMRNARQETGCEAVMISTLSHFKQREGGEYAADTAASAAFDLRIFDVAGKNVLWASDFNETQQSLLSNIFSFGKARSRGFKWITVEELVTQGVREKLAECPYLKI